MEFLWLILALFVIALIIVYFKPLPKKSIKGRHVVIIGGSSGIGKSVAILAAKRGANVTIIARNIEQLEEAKEEIEHGIHLDEQICTIRSVDVSNYEALENNFNEIEEMIGPIYMMINCAGMAIGGNLEDFTLQQIKQMVDTNFLGSLYALKAIVPKFKKRKEGIIVLTGSQVTLMGMFGFSVYSACKFALRGIAESLYMEVKPYNISVTLALPPDTDTPGFATENKTKPIETKLISEAGGLVTPEAVAKNLLDDALVGKFFSITGIESYMLSTLCTGTKPFNRFIDVFVESALLGPFRVIFAFYILSFNNIIKKCHREREILQTKT